MQINKRKIWMKLAGLLTLIFTGWLSINTVYAANCSNNRTPINVPTQNFNIPSYGATVGKPISEWIVITSPYVWNCPGQIYSSWAHVYLTSAGINYIDGGVSYLVLNSGVPNVGIIMTSKPTVSGGFVPIVSTADYWLVASTGSPRGTGFDMESRVRFIATGNFVPGSITVPEILITGAWIYGSSNTSATQLGQGFNLVGSYKINVTANTCNVDAGSKDQEITLADVSVNDLPFIGATAKDKTFNVSLNCQTGVYIYAELNGTKDTNAGDDGVLQVSNPGVAGTSSGIGIQILNGSTPMPIGNNMPVRMTSGGVETITFAARYYRTLASMSAGSANATATLNINYQ